MQQTTIYTTLKNHFGYSEFRFHQEAAITRILEGQSNLVIMPTGGGKSLCYQLPAILLDGLTVVVSPLIALMQDQVAGLQANGIAAQALNSQCSPEDERDIYQAVASGQLKLLYVSPERAVNLGFVNWLRQVKVAQLVVDEAHCVSMWGNDFRPEYAQLPDLLQHFPGVPVNALTATADPATRQDIVDKLGIRGAEIFVSSFERPNIHIECFQAQKRIEAITHYLKANPGQAGIIYCLSRKATEEIAQKLRAKGFNARHYHARMDADERRQVQDAFQQDAVDIVCATIAFGMGIDKPNIRWVIHYNLPKNVESYYQEIGRAGRDGAPAEAILFAGAGDLKTYLDFIKDSAGTEEYKEVQRKKLSRMWELTQTQSCRTNLVIGYFGEHRSTPCGHCDLCDNPPRGFDGTELAQKALSACYRVNQNAALTTLVQVLRGSYSPEVKANQYDQIKTFGAGKDHSTHEWNHYITQMVDQGLLAVDFHRQSKLSLTSLSAAVLKDGKTVQLFEPREQTLRNRTIKVEDNPEQPVDQTLYDKLARLRKQISEEKGGVPAYAVFTNATLKDMASKQPTTYSTFDKVSGVGKRKLEQFGERFIAVIREHLGLGEGDLSPLLGETEADAADETDERPTRPARRVNTLKETLRLLQEGYSTAEIAGQRGLTENTVIEHVLRLHTAGESVSIEHLISPDDIREIQACWQKLEHPNALRPVFEALEGRIGYAQIRYAIELL